MGSEQSGTGADARRGGSARGSVFEATSESLNAGDRLMTARPLLHTRRVGGLVIDGLAVLLIVSALLVAGLGVAAGWRPVVLLSGSMAPTAPAGALVVTAPVDAGNVEIGDVLVVTPSGSRTRVTHRVVALSDTPAGRSAVMRGDANDTVDAQPVLLSDTVPRMLFAVPELGGWLVRLGTRGVVGVALFIVGAVGLLALHRRE